MRKFLAGVALAITTVAAAAGWQSAPDVQDSLTIYTVEVDLLTGAQLSAPKRLVTDLPASWLPQYSRDGRRLSYLSSAGTGRAQQIVRQTQPVLSIRTLDTGQTTGVPLAFSQVFSYDWSPDGRTFVVRGTDMKDGYGIHLVDPATGNVTPLGIGTPNVVRYLDPQWLDDSRHVYYTKGMPGVLGEPLMERNLETGEERVFLDWSEVRATDGSALVGIRNNRVSPDRRHVAVFTGSGFASSALWVVSLETKSASELLRIDGNPIPLAGSAISWTADSRALLINRPEGQAATARRSLWVVRIDGSAPVKLAIDLPIQNLLPAVHPDGRRIAFVSGGAPAREARLIENLLVRPADSNGPAPAR
jgi:Tol biopolymer transport system component